jgi:hypothetical protein
MAKMKQTDDAAAGGTTPNKSQAIREALAANPKASPKEIAEIVNTKYALGVTGQYVSVIKSNDKQQSGKPRRRRGRPRVRAKVARTEVAGTPTVARKAGSSNSVDAAIGLIEAAGGLEQARDALKQLERLRGKL